MFPSLLPHSWDIQSQGSIIQLKNQSCKKDQKMKHSSCPTVAGITHKNSFITALKSAFFQKGNIFPSFLSRGRFRKGFSLPYSARSPGNDVPAPAALPPQQQRRPATLPAPAPPRLLGLCCGQGKPCRASGHTDSTLMAFFFLWWFLLQYSDSRVILNSQSLCCSHIGR